MRKFRKTVLLVLTLALALALFSMPALAVGEGAVVKERMDLDSIKAIAAAAIIAIGAGVGAFSMAKAIGKSVESMARQPEASGKIQTAMMLGLVFIETAIIYALIVAILIVFVL